MQPVNHIDRLSPTLCPDRAPRGYQSWSSLSFIHWRIPKARLRGLVLQRLSIDTFDGDAWMGIVLFQMSAVRPAWFPAIKVP